MRESFLFVVGLLQIHEKRNELLVHPLARGVLVATGVTRLDDHVCFRFKIPQWFLLEPDWNPNPAISIPHSELLSITSSPRIQAYSTGDSQVITHLSTDQA